MLKSLKFSVKSDKQTASYESSGIIGLIVVKLEGIEPHGRSMFTRNWRDAPVGKPLDGKLLGRVSGHGYTY